jgi:hypothetical protein
VWFDATQPTQRGVLHLAARVGDQLWGELTVELLADAQRDELVRPRRRQQHDDSVSGDLEAAYVVRRVPRQLLGGCPDARVVHARILLRSGPR